MDIPTDPIWAICKIIIIIIITTIISRVITNILNNIERFKDDMTGIYLIRDIIVYIIYFIALMDILCSGKMVLTKKRYMSILESMLIARELDIYITLILWKKRGL